ncbi:MurR/RpiR family transcriptional regulator [Ornithinibacillus sp. 4-3]|uniref:MurR/RpiR family transcriptional regulator n=1 Tax=Ornithinibacillus sp. 4-3 TaxID=3231488 RepID=A0AB39HT68_9BACI
MSFFDKIQNSLEHLSDAKKNVAYYLMDQWLDAAFLPASRVAKEVDVSESVVVRLSQDLGYSGFPELQKELQEILKSRLVSTDSIQKNQDLKTTSNNVHNNIYKVYEKSIENLTEVYNRNTIATFNEMLENIITAKRIVILARKNSLGPAHVLNAHINEVFSKSMVLDGESVTALDIIRGFTNKDLVIFIAIPTYSKRMIQYSNFLAEKKITQAAITNSNSNPFGKNAKCTLLTSADSLSFSNSHLATMFLIDTLIYLLTINKQGELLKPLEEMKVLNERFQLTES